MKTISLIALFCLVAAAVHGQMKVHIIDVGQGSAAIVEFPCGIVMIDTGGEVNAEFNSTDSLMKYMDKFFATRPTKIIDLLVLSHPHKDHTLGVKPILAKYKIKNVITNGMITGSGKPGQIALQSAVAKAEGTAATSDDIGYFQSIVEDIADNGTTSAVIDPINCTGTNPTIKVLWGQVKTSPTGWNKSDFANANNHSVVTRIDYGQSSIMFSGDLEIEGIVALMAKHSDKSVFDVDVYVASHHGAKNGTTPEFARALSPEIAIMSFGDPDRELSWTAYAYGHPNKNIVQTLVDNVSADRAIPKTVMVGDGAEKFETIAMSKAVYGIGWDGAIDLEATADGKWKYTERNPLINVNTADVATLKKLPTIGDARARAIITYRATRPFTKLEDLDNVTGIGAATLNLLASRIKFAD